MANDIIIYQTQDGKTKIDVKIENETKSRVPLMHPTCLSSLNEFASIWCCVENILKITIRKCRR